MNIPANFEINTWYKGFIFFGGILTVAGIFYPAQAFDNQNVSLLGFGFFIFGFSIWGNQAGGSVILEPYEEMKVKKSLKSYIVSIIDFVMSVIRFGLSVFGIILIFYSGYEIAKQYIIGLN